ncbi:hypothetical protein [Pseudomonas sp. BE134]|uniref:hypothetical protein n=1 Tax=Pseudomonas sp. BE134 TaxID=2817843 RepID=UPI0028644486|nr:hypothetical protein [Pseudomonas sp. BE134]MDR6926884.1 hypothetical protein [Pseudomonas sp. BE134]
MAKIDAPINDPQTSHEPVQLHVSALVSTQMKFRDKLYTSRQLILPETQRGLPVIGGVVEVPTSDTDAIKFLKAHDEFELLRE